MGTFRLTERENVMKEIKLSLDLKDGVFTINDGTIEALGRPRQVQLLINMQEKMLVLRACSVNDTQAVVLPKERVMSTEISGRSIMKRLRPLCRNSPARNMPPSVSWAHPAASFLACG